MNIVYISNSNIPSRTANSIHVMKMGNALSKTNELTLIGKKGSLTVQNICNYYGVEKIDLKLFEDGNIFKKAYFYAQLIKYLIKIDKSTLIIGRHLFGVFISSILGFEVIYETHGPPISKLHYYIEKYLISKKNVKKIVVISEELKNIYTKLYGAYVNKLQVLHDAADDPKSYTANTYLLRDGKDLSVGYIGHLYPGRGLDVIIKVARLMPEVIFHIVGGESNDIKYWKNEATSNLIFHGFVSPSETDKFRQGVDVLVMPYQENVSIAGSNNIDTSKWMSPMKLFEYMASNKPIVASDLTVLKEVLNEKNSILVKCDNVNEWKNALTKLKDNELRSEISNKAYNDFKTNYTWDIRAKKILN